MMAVEQCKQTVCILRCTGCARKRVVSHEESVGRLSRRDRVGIDKGKNKMEDNLVTKG